MLKQQLNNHEIDFNQKFPIFWFESNQCWGYVTEPKHLVYIQDLNSSNVLDAKCTPTYEKTRENPNFGLYKEHSGNIKLREFLKEKDVDLTNLNLYE